MCTAGTCGFCGWAMSEMPEAQNRGVGFGAGNVVPELGRELAETRGDVDAGLLEHAALHARHHAAVTGMAAVVGATPGRASESARRALGERRVRGQARFER